MRALLLAIVLLKAQQLRASGTQTLVVFKDATVLPALQAICSPTIDAFRAVSLPKDCQYLGAACTHVFTAVLTGLAVNVSPLQLAALYRCFPGKIAFEEPDGAVFKAEDENLFLLDDIMLKCHKENDFPCPPLGKTGKGDRRSSLLRRRQLYSQRSLSATPDTETPPVLPSVEFEADASIPGTPIDDMLLSQQGAADLSIPILKDQELSLKLWNLDRIDQVSLPLNGVYAYGSQGVVGLGLGVTIYALDTGIYADHQEFGPLPSSQAVSSASATAVKDFQTASASLRPRASCGFDFINGSTDCVDVDGHGSHVAGVAIGLQVGVAKGASLVSVKMLDSNGLGTVSNTVSALDWVAANHRPGTPAVVTMSLGVQQGTYTQSMESAVTALVNDHGITVVVAAGNAEGDACFYSPAAVPQAFTVGASDLDTKYSRSAGPHVEGVYVQGNQGPCVDIFAPGVDVWSVCGGTRRCGNVTTMTYAYASGTSMAVPHVAGAAALYLEAHPTASPGEVRAAILDAASKGLLNSNILLQGTPNSLLMTRMHQGSLVQAAQGPSGG